MRAIAFSFLTIFIAHISEAQTNAVASSDDDYGWSVMVQSNSMDQKGTTYGDYSYQAYRLFSNDPTQPQLRFGCSDVHGLTATIRFQPANEGEPTGSGVIRPRQRATKLSIEGREPVQAHWFHIKSLRTVQNRKANTARMLYNAVIQGKVIRVKEPLRNEVTIRPPAVDEAFKTFHTRCHITRG
ncbi:MAG: hypothetical protein AAGF20_06565 [Pseudomonadota bacterium]